MLFNRSQVAKLDDDDPDVFRHREDHLPKVLRLLFFGSLEGDLGELGDAVDQFGNLLSELLFDLFGGGMGVFHGVVEKAGDHARDVELEFDERLGDLGRVDHVRLAARSLLATMGFVGERVRLHQEVDLGLRVVAFDAVADLFDRRGLMLGHSRSVLAASGSPAS
jgi:hypothetical protein